MRIQINSIAVLLCMIGFTSVPALAVTTSDTASMNAQLQALEKEVNELKQQINHNDVTSNTSSNTKHRVRRHRAKVATTSTTSSTSVQETTGAPAGHVQGVKQPLYLPIDLEVPGQSFVSTGPYVGVPFQFSGSDLIINSPSVNTDLQLLNVRKKIIQQLSLLEEGGDPVPHKSHLLLSGIVEGNINYSSGPGTPNNSDIDVTNVSLDAFFMGPSDWTLGYMEFSYDNDYQINTFFRTSNSRVFLNKAFITVGDLNISPFYGTIGQFYVPFGVYSSFTVSDPLTKLLARTKGRAALVGFEQQDTNGFYGSAFGFRGDSRTSSAIRVNNGGVNLGYKFNTGWFRGKFGGSVIGNIADSVGEQLGNGFAFYELIDHRVPAYNLRTSLSLGDHIDLVGEYIGTTTRFDVNDMMYNNRGAQPSAYDLEASYSFTILQDKPSSLGVAFSKSRQALSLGIPRNRTLVVFNTSLFRNTLQSLEFRHDLNYNSTDVANGPQGAVPLRGSCTSAVCQGTGKADNAVTAQFDYYF